MVYKKLILSSVLTLGIFLGSSGYASAQDISYKVQSGDTFYLISLRYGVSAASLMKANNATESTILYPGKFITIPSATPSSAPTDNHRIHTVVPGETYWSISQKYGVSFIKLLEVNQATDKSWLNIGDKVILPVSVQPVPNPQTTLHTVQAGDTFYLLSQKYKVSLTELMQINHATASTVLYIGQKLQIPQVAAPAEPTAPSTPATPAPAPPPAPVPAPSKPTITYSNYTVKSGDTLWSIADKSGIPMSELLAANNMTESTWLTIGDIIKIPVHSIPVKATPGEQYGEYLDWWTEAQYVVPTQSVFEVVDFQTGKSFLVKRTTGYNHADVETLNFAETEKMKEIWNGTFSWERRPVIIKINGRKIAASVTSLPHAGNDSVAGGLYTTWRSENYPPGYNLDWVKNNGINGVIDIHFANSTRHNDGLIDAGHQENIKIAAGLI